MSGQDKRWDFDQYDWTTRDYDERMRNAKHLRYDETLSSVLEKGCHVFGLDPSSKLLAIAEQKLKEWQGHFQVHLCEDPFLMIPFPEQALDAVVSTFSIHHISDEAKRISVREMKRVLKPDGQIIIGDVMFKDTEDKLHVLNKYPDMEEEYQPMLDNFAEMFEDEGFNVEVEQVADTVWIVCASLG